MDPSLGQYGEELAAVFLTERGYKIMKTNYRSCYGEIDIIAQDGEVLCFIEVKTREDDALGSPLEAVTPVKQRKIATMAQIYIDENHLDNFPARFDVVGVVIRSARKDGAPAIELIQDAFWLE